MQKRIRISSLWVAVYLAITAVTHGRGDDRLVGIWAYDEGFQVV